MYLYMDDTSYNICIETIVNISIEIFADNFNFRE